MLITDPAGGIPVGLADMMIPADEVHAFEEDNEMVRRTVAGPGATASYNWDGMMVALIQRIHNRGVPVTQSELVTDMQDWFADQTDGAKIPDSRTIRRRLTPVWKMLHLKEA